MDQDQKRRPTKNSPVTRHQVDAYGDGFQIPYYPVGDRIVVERSGEDDVVTSAGIVVAARNKDELSFGTLIAAGLQALDKLHSMGIAIGDKVAFGKWAGIHWDWNPPNANRIRVGVDILDVKDILGGAELCDDIMSGEVAIQLHEEPDGFSRHRLFRRQPEAPELTETESGELVGTPVSMTVADVEAEILKLKRLHGQAHLKQDTATMETVQRQIRDMERIKNQARRGVA